MLEPTSTGLSPQFQRLIQRTLQSERQPKVELENQREQKKNFDSVLDTFDTKLSSLHGNLQGLTDTVSNPFDGRSAQPTEETSAFSVSANDQASLGTHTLTVNRLASADGRVSETFNADGTGLRNFFDTNGEQTFSVEVATPTDDNPDNRTSIDVTVNPDGSTNEEILNDIRTAIDDAFDSAVDNETIESDERPTASVINPTSGEARLSLRSASTGFRGRLSFTDSADSLLADIELNAGQLADDTNGGMIKTVGSDEQTSKLTSEFELDGLTLFRNTNNVTDALDGVTIDLQDATGTNNTFEVTPDSEGAKEEVTTFVDNFNEVLSFIDEKTNVDAESGNRGDFAGERTFRSLRFNLRNEAIEDVSGLPDGLNSLRDIGVEMNEDGTLELADEDALTSAVRTDPDVVKELFMGDDGVATRMKARVDRFVEAGGVLDERQDSVDATVDRLDDRIGRLEDRLSRREEQLRERFTEVEQTIRSLQRQQQSISQRLGITG